MTPTEVSYQMYDLPQCTDQVAAFRSALASAVGGVALKPDGDGLPWRAQDLLLSQTCGWPLVTSEAPFLRPVATPLYAVAGCEQRQDCATYTSVFVVRRGGDVQSLGDAVGRVVAMNGWDSWSGHVTLRNSLAELDLGTQAAFSGVFVSGSHLKSLMAVRAGRADIASLDAVTFELIKRYQPALADGIDVIGRSDWAPALPLVTRKDAPDETVGALRHALTALVADKAQKSVLDSVLITAFVETDLTAYQRTVDLAQRAASVTFADDAPVLPKPTLTD